MDWNSAIAGSGGGARYDVMQGALSQLPPGSGPSEICLANNEPAQSLTDDTNLASGAGVYFLVRASNACGTGDYGAGSSAGPRVSSACP
jgi:hypothetical protein